MGRYLRPIRMIGAGGASAELLDFGQQLLGYLDTQQKLGAPRALSLFRDTPDGSVLASLVLGRATLVMKPLAKPIEEVPLTLDGLVFWPTPTDSRPGATWANFGDHPQVLALIESAHQPNYRTGGFSRYKTTFTDGLGPCGNIDWRNTDESQIISFYGPPNRYFSFDFGATVAGLSGTGISRWGFQPWVFRNGEIILDTTASAFINHPLVQPLHYNWCVVGAGFRGGKLVFVARNDVNGVGGTREYCFSIGMRGDVDAAIYTPNYNSLELLGYRTLLSNENGGEGSHPWMFNQKGTEARCIRYVPDGSGDPTVYEGVLDATTGSFSFNAIHSTADLTLTTTTSASVSGSKTLVTTIPVNEMDYTFDTSTPDGHGSYYHSGATTTTNTAAVVSSPFGNGTVTTDVTISKAFGVTQIKIAVDYLNNVPVYGWLKLPTQTTTVHDVSADTATLALASISASWSDATTTDITEHVAQIVTDFETTAFADFTYHGVYSYSASYSLTRTFTPVSISPPPGTYWSDEFTYDTSSSREQSQSLTETFAGSAQDAFGSGSAASALTYMDLRYGWLVAENQTYVASNSNSYDTGTITGSTSTTIGGTGPGSIGAVTYVDGVDKSGAHSLPENWKPSFPTESVSGSVTVDSTFSAISTVKLENVSEGTDTRSDVISKTTADSVLIHFGPHKYPNPGSGSTTTDYARLTDIYVDTPNNNTLTYQRRGLRPDNHAIARIGSWTNYKNHWAYSMGLPVSQDHTDSTPLTNRADRWLNGIENSVLSTLCTNKTEYWTGGIKTGINAPPFDLFFPISAVSKTTT